MKAFAVLAAILWAADWSQAQTGNGGTTAFQSDESLPRLNGPIFAAKLQTSPSWDANPVIIVLLPDHTYREFFPADVLTLRQLIDKLPSGTITPTTSLYLIRKHEGLAFTPKNLQTEDLTHYSLARWDVVKIDNSPSFPTRPSGSPSKN